jgi:hypothetical protein
MAKDTIGIDVSKDRLDAFWHSQDAALSLPNTVEGFAQLCTWLGKNGVLLFSDLSVRAILAKGAAASGGIHSSSSIRSIVAMAALRFLFSGRPLYRPLAFARAVPSNCRRRRSS